MSRGATRPPRGRRAATCRRGAPGISASTTRAPSSSSRSTYCSAARFSGSAAPPTDGGFVSRPTVSPARRGSGTGASASTDHMSATSSTVCAIGPTVSKVGQSGKTPSTGMRPQLGFSPTRSQHAAGRRIEQPVSVPMPEVAEARGERRGVAARRAAGRAARVARVLHRPVPRVLARHAPRELVQVRLADDDGARRARAARPPVPCGPARGPRRSSSRTSCGCRRCRSGPSRAGACRAAGRAAPRPARSR